MADAQLRDVVSEIRDLLRAQNDLLSNLLGIFGDTSRQQTVPPQKNLVTVAEVAALLDMCEDTIRRWAQFGKIPAFKGTGTTRGKWLIPRDALIRLIAARSQVVENGPRIAPARGSRR